MTLSTTTINPPVIGCDAALKEAEEFIQIASDPTEESIDVTTLVDGSDFDSLFYNLWPRKRIGYHFGAEEKKAGGERDAIILTAIDKHGIERFKQTFIFIVDA